VSELIGRVPLHRHLLYTISEESLLPYNSDGEDKWNSKMMATVLKRAKGKVVEAHANEVSCTYP
jgi:hypothetical protein